MLPLFAYKLTHALNKIITNLNDSWDARIIEDSNDTPLVVTNNDNNITLYGQTMTLFNDLRGKVETYETVYNNAEDLAYNGTMPVTYSTIKEYFPVSYDINKTLIILA